MHHVSTESAELMKVLKGHFSDSVLHFHKPWERLTAEAWISWWLWQFHVIYIYNVPVTHTSNYHEPNAAVNLGAFWGHWWSGALGPLCPVGNPQPCQCLLKRLLIEWFSIKKMTHIQDNQLVTERVHPHPSPNSFTTFHESVLNYWGETAENISLINLKSYWQIDSGKSCEMEISWLIGYYGLIYKPFYYYY